MNHKEICNLYYQLRKDEILRKRRDYYEKNKEKMRNRRKKYVENNKEKERESAKKTYIKNKEKKIKKACEYYKINIDYIRKRKSKYYQENKDKIKAYINKNRVKIRVTTNTYVKKKKDTDPLFKLKHTLRSRVSSVMRKGGYKKSSLVNILLGADFETVKKHIERRFTKGMSWELLGKEIHIDHIVPLCSAKTEEDLIKLFHYTNLQPLWKTDNLKKNKKIPSVQLILTI